MVAATEVVAWAALAAATGALVVAVSTVAALPVVSAVATSKAAASVLGWPAVSVMEDPTIVTVAVSTIATLDAVLDSASSHTITMTTTLMIIYTGMATTMAAIAMWFSDGCTQAMAGAGNPFKSAVDGLS